MDSFTDKLIDSNESGRMLAFLASKKVAPGERGILLPEILSSSRNNSLKADRTDVQVARDALLAIYDRNGGDEGLMDFAKWAIDPVNGFHGQLPSRVPLPTNIKKLFLQVAEQANREAPLPKAKPPTEDEQISRRWFLKKVAAGTIGATSLGGASAAAASIQKRGWGYVAPHAAVGGLIGVGAASVGEGIEEAKRKYDGPYSAHIQTVRNNAKAVVVTGSGRKWDIDSVALAASELLRNYVEAGLSKSGWER